MSPENQMSSEESCQILRTIYLIWIRSCNASRYIFLWRCKSAFATINFEINNFSVPHIDQEHDWLLQQLLGVNFKPSSSREPYKYSLAKKSHQRLSSKVGLTSFSFNELIRLVALQCRAFFVLGKLHWEQTLSWSGCLSNLKEASRTTCCKSWVKFSGCPLVLILVDTQSSYLIHWGQVLW